MNPPATSLVNRSLRGIICLRSFKKKSTRRHHAFTLIELVVVVGILLLLAALALPAVNGILASGRATKSTANLRQIYAAVADYVVDSDGRYPYAFGASSTPRPPGANDKERGYWYDVVKARLYPHSSGSPLLSRLDGPSGWGPASLTDTTGTVLRSPNVEKSWPVSVISYGYNNRFSYDPTNSQKLALIYDNSKTVLLADNMGNTHSLTPENSTTVGKLNARNGASRDFATNGKAIVVYIDGHSELLSADNCASLNADKTHVFWGVKK